MRKRRIIVATTTICMIFGILGWMGYKAMGSLKEKEARSKTTQSFSSVLASLGLSVATPPGVSMLLYFNSECEHCKWEIQQLSENIDQFSKINLAMVSLEPADTAYRFLQGYSLEDYFIKTKPENIMKTFSGGVPQIFIYEGDSLKKKFKGEVKIEVLLEVIDNNH